MKNVFNETLLTDMGRTKVRKYLKTTNEQAVWKEYSEYMTTSSKGASEKRNITHYLTNTMLDNQFRGTTQQFVLHFSEQFRRLDVLTDISERMPESMTEFRQPLQVQSHLEMPRILVQLGHTQRT